MTAGPFVIAAAGEVCQEEYGKRMQRAGYTVSAQSSHAPKYRLLYSDFLIAADQIKAIRLLKADGDN